MSTYWGYYCQACKEESEHWLNRGQEFLREYHALQLLMKQSEQTFDNLTVGIDGYDWAKGEMGEFFDKHSDHDIVLKNEYGNTEVIKEEYDLKSKSSQVLVEYLNVLEDAYTDLKSKAKAKAKAKE